MIPLPGPHKECDVTLPNLSELPIINSIWQEFNRTDQPGGQFWMMSAHLDTRDPYAHMVRILMYKTV